MVDLLTGMLTKNYAGCLIITVIEGCGYRRYDKTILATLLDIIDE
jgi:hypothetical protein